MDNLFSVIDANREMYLDELFGFLRQKSISATGEGVRDCALMLKDMMERAGISTRIFETAGHPVVYGEVISDPSLPTVLIYGHYDVQPPEPLELWNSDPFEPVIRDGKIFARGSSDNKAQMFAHIKGTEACLKNRGKLPVNMKYLFEGEEETGSPNLYQFVHDNKDLLKCDIAIMSDSHIHESGRPLVILGLKGMCYVEIKLKEANRDLHSKYAAVVTNPAWRLQKLLSTLRDENGFIKIEGFYDDVRELLELEKEAVKKIPFDREFMLKDLGICEFTENRTGRNYFYNMIFEPTCNIAGLKAGYIGEGSKTVLPNSASVKMDLRLVPDQKPEKILKLLRDHLDKNGFEDAEIESFGNISPSRTPIDNPYVGIIADAIRRVWKDEPVIYPNIGGSGPNYVFDENLRVPSFVVPFANADQNNHAPNENMSVIGFMNGIKTCVAVMDVLAENNFLEPI